MLANAEERYLDLLKRSVTGTLFVDEPDHDSADVAAFVARFTDHYIEGRASAMVPVKRLDSLRSCLLDLVAREVPGDVIEAGVWRGGTSIFMRGVLDAIGATDRRVWLADSFEGLPPVDPSTSAKEHRAVNGPVIRDAYRNFAASLDEVRSNFAAYRLLDERTVFLKGWFRDSLPTIPRDSRFALIRLDADLFESTRDALTLLYPRLSRGGYLVVDDYGESLWTDCRRAVDEFRRAHDIHERIVPVDSRCVFWIRES